MPFDPIRDVQPTVDVAEQLRRHGAVLAVLSQPLQLPNFIHQTINKAIQSKARVGGRHMSRYF